MTAQAASPRPLDYFASVRTRLAALPTELIGEYRQPKKILGVARAPRIVAVGSAWHLGVLLITPDAVLATGDVARSLEPARRGYTALSARERDELRFAAHRGGVPAGRAVHFNWVPVDLEVLVKTGTSGPLAIQEDELRVRWSPAGGYAPLQRYVDERIELAQEAAAR